MPLPKLAFLRNTNNSDAAPSVAAAAASDVARSADSLVIARARLSTNSNTTSGGSAPATPAAASAASAAAAAAAAAAPAAAASASTAANTPSSAPAAAPSPAASEPPLSSPRSSLRPGPFGAVRRLLSSVLPRKKKRGERPAEFAAAAGQ